MKPSIEALSSTTTELETTEIVPTELSIGVIGLIEDLGVEVIVRTITDSSSASGIADRRWAWAGQAHRSEPVVATWQGKPQ